MVNLRRFLFVLFAAHCGVLFAQMPPEPITAVSLSGLKRTKPHVAERPLQKFIGRDASTLDLNEVRAAVIDTGILEPVSVEIKDDPGGGGKILTVDVQEKWSLLPLPMFFAGSGGMSVGGFLMDLNAFGLNDKMVLGGMYSTDGWRALGMYSHTPGREYTPGWNTSVYYAREERENTDQRGNTLRQYNLDSLNASVGIQYPLWNVFTPAVRFSFNLRMLRNHDFPVAAPQEGARAAAIAPGLSLRKSRWDGYLISQQSAELRYTFTAGIQYPSSHAVSFQGLFERPVIPGFKAGVRAGALYDPNAAVLFESSPSAARVDILPRSFSARNYAGVSAEIEKYLLKFTWGTISALASYQAVWSQGPILDHEFDHGAAASARLYLSRLAMPALGFGVAYNVRAEYFQFAFNAGMSF